jgi:N-acetylglucosaminyldiphosphoundecaprenol N-acetyl-beta-D-mannosaminyltransferase
MKEIFGLTFAVDELASLTARIISEQVPEGTGPRMLVTANVDHIVNLRTRAEFRSAYANAWVRTADGMPVYLYARLRGAAVRSRVTGSDLFAKIFESLNPAIHRVFFMACTEQIGRSLKDLLVRRGFPEESVEFSVPRFGFENDRSYSYMIAAQIRGHRTTHLFVGLGAPKSEIWCHQYGLSFGDCYVLCVGAGLAFYTGHKKRAPKVLQKAGFEWLWRFGQEPHRLFHRYFVKSWSFLGAIADDLGGVSTNYPEYVVTGMHEPDGAERAA